MGETRRNPSFIVSRTPPSQIRNFQLQNLAIVFHHPKMRRGGIGHRLVAGQSMNVYVDATINASPILKLLSSLEHVVNVGHLDRFPWGSTTSSVYPQHRGTQRVGLPSRGGDVVIMLVPLGGAGLRTREVLTGHESWTTSYESEWTSSFQRHIEEFMGRGTKLDMQNPLIYNHIPCESKLPSPPLHFPLPHQQPPSPKPP
jgi:hypothetical protein